MSACTASLGRRSAAAAVVVLVAVAAAPDPVAAITKRQADAVAKRALRTGLSAPRQAILFGLPRRLRRGARIAEAGPRSPSAIARVRRPVWMYWLDLAPGAAFGHRSILLIIDDRSGRPVLARELGWWPLVNGRRLPWHRSDAGYAHRRHRVAGGFAAARDSLPPVARLAQAPARFANDCIVTVGDRADPLWRGTFTTIEGVAARIGLRLRRAQQKSEVAEAVAAFREETPPCTDVVIFIAGHGSRHPRTRGRGAESRVAETTVSVPSSRGGRRAQSPIRSEDLRAVFKRNRDITFKLIVSSCYSGRWIDDLEDEQNLRIAVAGAQSDQVEFRTDDPREQPGRQTPDGLEKDPRAKPLRDPTTNPDDAFDFANGIARGLEDWANDLDAQERTGDDLGKGIADAFERQLQQNFAQQLGWQSADIADHTTERPEPRAP